MAMKPLNLSPTQQDGLDRRVFIKGLGYVSLGLFLSTLGGCESCVERIENRPTRRRLRTGSTEVDAAIATYKAAVTQMKALQSSDPRSWAAQAAIHGVGNSFNHCEHGTDHFFSWHRAYLLYFERICQELTGDSDFGLPYWNWNQSPQMHPAFTDPNSPLHHQPRSSTTVGNNAAFSDQTLNTIFSDSNFYTFSSQLEGSPHDMAHVLVGGTMVTGGSPLDPIFWAHHCMVDYCWAKWNNELGNDNPSAEAWNTTSWNHFVDGDGNPVSVTAGITVLMPLLSYQYESSAIGSHAAKAEMAARDFKELEERLKEGADVQFEIKRRIRVADRAAVSLARPFSSRTPVAPEELNAVIESDGADERLFASIEWAQLPPTNDFFVRVFINLPTADLNTSTDDPHYAGSFAFFGTHSEGGKEHQGKTDFLVNVTPTLRRLKESGEAPSGAPISVQLVAVPVGAELARPDAELVLEKIDLLVTPVFVRSE